LKSLSELSTERPFDKLRVHSTMSMLSLPKDERGMNAAASRNPLVSKKI
jgi:hypothetical protein